MTVGSVADIIQRGGTILYTARCEEFKTEEGQKKAHEVLKENGIEGLLRLNHALARGKKHSIIVVAEGTQNANDVGRYISENTAFDVRVTILGHLQRGGAPTAWDRSLASRLGNYAVELLKAGEAGQMVSVLEGKLHSAPLDEVFNNKHQIDKSLYDLVHTLAI